jgi:hypothetical protein
LNRVGVGRRLHQPPVVIKAVESETAQRAAQRLQALGALAGPVRGRTP